MDWLIIVGAVSIHDTCPLTGRDRRGHVVNKEALSESDICDRYVTPALDTAGWTTNQWRREYGFTDGKIIVRGKLVARGKRKRADYLKWLFPDEGVFPARRSRGRGRGLPKMEVLTLPIWKTSTCLTLLLMRAWPALI